MAPGLPAPLLLLAALALRWAHGDPPTIRLIDPEGPILEGSRVTLECLAENGADMSQFTFQKYSRWLQSWVSLDGPNRLRCWFYDVNVTRADGRLLLAIEALQSWHAGPYRCVASNGNGSAASNSSAASNGSDASNGTSLRAVSAELNLHVEYLRSIFLTRAHTWCGTVGNSLVLEEGEELELQCSAEASQPPQYEWSRQGDDWVVASPTLRLPRVSQELAGTYVCRAWLPGLPQLVRSRAVQLSVQGVRSSFQLDPGQGLSTPVLLLAVGLPALLLLLLVLALGLFVLRHRNRAKGDAPEEPGQRIPIYKGSLDSVPSVVGDKQPLVL